MPETSNINIDDLAITVGAIVAVALALATAIGPTVMYLTEAIKKAFHVENGSGGLIATVLSVVLTSILALVTTYLTQVDADTREYIAAVGVGAVIGIFVGGGAVQAYKAAGSINPSTENFRTQFNELMSQISTEEQNAVLVAPAEVSFENFNEWSRSDDVDTEPSTADIVAAGPNPTEPGDNHGSYDPNISSKRYG